MIPMSGLVPKKKDPLMLELTLFCTSKPRLFWLKGGQLLDWLQLNNRDNKAMPYQAQTMQQKLS